MLEIQYQKVQYNHILYGFLDIDINYGILVQQVKYVHSIEIEFETKDTTPSTGSNNGEWLTHPAFTSFNSNGFWVGKFETGYNGATSTSAAQVNSSDTSKAIIKPMAMEVVIVSSATWFCRYFYGGSCRPI